MAYISRFTGAEIDEGIEKANSAVDSSYVDDAESRAKSHANSVAGTALSDAKTYADNAAETALGNAKKYTDTETDAALSEAKGFADGEASKALNSANSYTRQKVAETEQYVDSKAAAALRDAKSYTDSKIPTKLPNPNALTFKGATSGTYDGSASLEITIPEGGGSSGESDIVLPDYWKTHIDEQIANIRTALESAGCNKSAFLWYNDAHWSYSYQQSPAILKYLYKNTPINKVNFGGDICDTESANRDDMTYLWDWRKAIRDIPNHHSVVGNHDDGGEFDFLIAYTYSWLLAAEETPDIVRGDVCYYYIDNPSEKTRYLYLDTATKNYNIMNNTDQQEFVKEALKSTPDSWHIVAIAHIWRAVDYDVTPPADNGWSYGGTTCLEMFYAYNNRSGEYAGCGGKVEFCIGGHTHVDANWLYNDSIPVILTECEGRNVRGNTTCTAGTITESAVSAVIADYNNSKIHIIRIGRGESRVVDIPATTQTSYTNLLPLATDENGAVYNGIGYMENVRINSSKQIVAANGWDLTGFIPAKPGDIIRFKNVAFLDMTGANATQVARVFFYDSNYTQINTSDYYTPANLMSEAWNAVYGDDGNLIQFMIPLEYGSNTAYIRINADDFNENSIITVNEEIVGAQKKPSAKSEPVFIDITADGTNMELTSGDFTTVYDAFMSGSPVFARLDMFGTRSIYMCTTVSEDRATFVNHALNSSTDSMQIREYYLWLDSDNMLGCYAKLRQLEV